MILQPQIVPKSLPADWLAHRYDPGHDAVHFLQVDRATRASIPFLTDENLGEDRQPLVLRRSDAMHLATPPAPIHFIFHSAYCCSTLLANAFDTPGESTSLKEPVILNDLVGWRHRGGTSAQVAPVLDAALTLMARPFETDESVVIKPSNLLNYLAPDMLTARPDAGCVLLYAPLNLYLGSIAAKGLWGRLWVRDLLGKQLSDGMIDLGFEPEDYLLQSDLQVAAVGWLAQHNLFARMALRWPDRIRTLNSETLLDQPEAALSAISDLFGISASPDTLSATVGKVFRRHAKFGGEFGKAEREAGQKSAAALHGDELEKVIIWAEAVAQNADVSMNLPGSLL